jgi:hypothetical protein
MIPTESRPGLTPIDIEARVLGFLAFGVVALGIVFCLLSGHTLKHLAAAVGAYWLYHMVR